MFVRSVTKKSKNKIYYTYKLVETIRTERGPRQQDVLNLGSDFSLPREDWKSFANRVEEILLGITSFIPCSETVELFAKRYANLIIHQRQGQLKKEPLPDDQTKTPSNNSKQFVSVDVGSLIHTNARTIGCEHILYSLFQELKISQCLRKNGFNDKEIKIAAATIIARATFPASELRTHFFLQETSALGEQLDIDFSKVPLYRLYQISDRLLDCKESLEAHLEQQEREIFSLKETILLYDITNTYFESIPKNNNKAAYGKSKEKRGDCPLVSLGLVLDQEGFPKRSAFLEGNVVETKAFAAAIEKLTREHDQLFRPTIVMDAGIASQANLDWLKAHQYPYVTIFRSKRRKLPKTGSWIEVKSIPNNTVKAFLVDDKETGERYLYCHSTARHRRDGSIKNRRQKAFEDELNALNNKLSNHYWQKSPERVIEKIGKLRQKFERVSRFYQIELIKDEHGRPKKIQYQYNASKIEEQFNGTYCLRTTVDRLNEQELWKIYMMLSNAEEAFRDMKSHLGLRPLCHQLEHRIDGHMWITLLAYHLIQSATYRLGQSGINISWQAVRDRMKTQMRVSTQVKTQDGKMLHIRETTEPEIYQKEIYRALGISQKPLKKLILEV